MKKINYLLFFVLIGSISFMASCGSDDDAELPTITITYAAPAAGYLPGQTVLFNVVTYSNAKLQTITISANTASAAGNGITTVTAEAIDLTKETGPLSYDFDGGPRTATITYAYIIPNDAVLDQSITVSFTVTDKDASATVAAEPFAIEEATDPGTAMTDENVDGIIYHILGVNQGAWDLVANKGKSSSDAADDKDMINETSGVKGTFLREWSAGNTTTFVLVDLDYAAVTDLMASAAFALGTATNHVMAVAKDQIYIAKLRGGDDYAVIKILDVVETDNDNNDNIKFSYKKKPATATKSTGPQKLIYY